MVQQSLPGGAMRCDLDEPDGRFHGFDLAEERAYAAEIVMPPMLEQPGSFRGHLPLAGVRQGTPRINLLAHLVDDGSNVVLLFLGRESLAFIQHHFLLLGGAFSLLWLGDWCDEFGPPAGFENLLCGLPVLIQFPMPRGASVGRIQNWMVKEWIRHFSTVFQGSTMVEPAVPSE